MTDKIITITQMWNDDRTREATIEYNPDTWQYRVIVIMKGIDDIHSKIHEFPTLRQAENYADHWIGDELWSNA